MLVFSIWMSRARAVDVTEISYADRDQNLETEITLCYLKLANESVNVTDLKAKLLFSHRVIYNWVHFSKQSCRPLLVIRMIAGLQKIIAF